MERSWDLKEDRCEIKSCLCYSLAGSLGKEPHPSDPHFVPCEVGVIIFPSEGGYDRENIDVKSLTQRT